MPEQGRGIEGQRTSWSVVNGGSLTLVSSRCDGDDDDGSKNAQILNFDFKYVSLIIDQSSSCSMRAPPVTDPALHPSAIKANEREVIMT